MGGTIDARTNLYMLSLTHLNNLMTEPKTPDEYFQGGLMSANRRRLWWTTTTHPAGAPLTQDGERQSLKTFSLLGQAYQWTWFKNTSRKNNPQYLSTSSNRGRASDSHNTRSCTQTHIQSRTSSLKLHSHKTPILSF